MKLARSLEFVIRFIRCQECCYGWVKVRVRIRVSVSLTIIPILTMVTHQIEHQTAKSKPTSHSLQMSRSTTNQKDDLCTQQRLRSGWSEFLLCAQWVAREPRCLHADSEDRAYAQADLSLCWAHIILFVLSCFGSDLSSKFASSIW